MSFYSVFAAVLALLLFAFSASQLGLGSYVLHYNSTYAQVGHRTFEFRLSNASVLINFWYLPLVALTRSYALQVTTGAIGIVVALVTFVLSFRSKSYSMVISGKRAPRNIAWPGISIGLSTLLFLLALPTIVITFFDDAHFGRQSVPDSTICLFEHGISGSTPNNCGSSINYYRPFTIEAWTCKLSSSYMSHNLALGNEAGHTLRRTCQISTISRWWTIPLLVLPILIIITAFLEIRRKNMERFALEQQQESYLYPKDQSFSSAETTSPTSPVSPISTLPQYSLNAELQSKSKVGAEMGGKQVLEAPGKMSYEEMPAQQHQVYNELPANKSTVEVEKS